MLILRAAALKFSEFKAALASKSPGFGAEIV
jgi:hypothetical protein